MRGAWQALRRVMVPNAEHRRIASLDEFDPNRVSFALIFVIFSDTRAKLTCLHPYDGVNSGIEGLPFAENLDSEAVFLKSMGAPFERFVDHEGQEVSVAIGT